MVSVSNAWLIKLYRLTIDESVIGVETCFINQKIRKIQNVTSFLKFQGKKIMLNKDTQNWQHLWKKKYLHSIMTLPS